MWLAVLRGLEKLSARNLPPLHLPASWSCLWSPSGRTKAGISAVWLDWVEEGLAKVPAWTKSWLLSPQVLRQVPGQGWGAFYIYIYIFFFFLNRPRL